MIEKPHKLIPLLPLASALCLLIVFVFYSLILGMPDFEMLDKVQVSEQVEAEFRARALWGVTAACLDIALIWNIVISIIISRHNFESFRNARKYAVYIAIASLPPYLLITFNWAFGGAASHFMQRQIAAHANSWVVPLTTINNFISGVVITLLVFTCCSLLYWPESMKKNRANGNNVIRMVAKRIEFGRLSLYSAGALLVIGIFEMHYLFSWPSSFIAEPEKTTVRSIANSLSLAAGLLFSFLLVNLYLPVAIIHRHWISELAYQAGGQREDFDKAKWLQRHGVEMTTLDILKGGIAIIAPSIAGLLVKILA